MMKSAKKDYCDVQYEDTDQAIGYQQELQRINKQHFGVQINKSLADKAAG